jgi:endonuclease-3 related protein
MQITPFEIYKLLLDYFGPQDWWPIDKNYHRTHKSDPRFEIIVGAVLTQNTAWNNVEKALCNLKDCSCLNIRNILETDIKILRNMIQPSGFFNQKATRVKNIAYFLNENYNGDLDKFFNQDLQEIRNELLSLNGVGPETADSIILYSGNLPVFVVDAYTKRICKRLPINIKKLDYFDIQQHFEKNLQKHVNMKDLVSVYKELHALIVVLAKNFCTIKPVCNTCPLQNNCFKRLL